MIRPFWKKPPLSEPARALVEAIGTAERLEMDEFGNTSVDGRFLIEAGPYAVILRLYHTRSSGVRTTYVAARLEDRNDVRAINMALAAAIVRVTANLVRAHGEAQA